MSIKSISELRKARSGMDSLMKEVEKLTDKTSSRTTDDRFWQPTVDKAGNGTATIRFLPAPKGEDVPWVQIWSHGFKNEKNGQWYIENSLTTIGKSDPVSDYNTKLWNSGFESDKAIARAQKRKLNYISNIIVVKDPEHPENEGKVFLYKYGQKVFDKIKDAMKPEDQDETPFNPFDLWEGANFKLIIRKEAGFRNYDKSKFTSQSEVSSDEDELQKIWETEHSLQEFLKPENFKTYDELKARLDKVLNSTGTARSAATEVELEDEVVAPPKQKEKKSKLEQEEMLDDDDDTASYFSKLAEQD
jgi:hypothetical protein